MKASKGQIGRLVDSPDPETRLYLLHGPDEAGANEFAARLARALGPGLEIVDLDSRALRESPGRLADEAASMSLFGEKRLIRVAAAEDNAIEAFALLLSAERAGNPVVATGPALKASGKLAKLAIAAPNAVAFACYVPDGIEAVRLATTIAREHGLRLAGDVAQRLVSASAADRAIMSREIEKLALYLDAAPDRPRDADGRALDAIGADLGDAEMFEAIEAMIDGRVAEAGATLVRLSESGGSSIPLLRNLMRRLLALAELRAQVDAGASVDQLIEKPGIFFKEKPATGRALRRWSAAQLARAAERVRETERSLMRSSSAGDVLADAECIAIARAAARMRG